MKTLRHLDTPGTRGNWWRGGNQPYTITLEEVDDFSSDSSTTGAVAVGASVTGRIGVNDNADWFAVDLEAGKTYRIDVKGSESPISAARWPIRSSRCMT